MFPCCSSETYPFFDTNVDDIIALTFNSSIIEPTKYDLATLKSKFNFINLNDDNDNKGDVTDLITNCDYYSLESLGALLGTSNLAKQKLKIFHTNICSLECDSENLVNLLDNSPLSFDIISLTETWNPKSKKHKFTPAILEGYQEYHGINGTTLKSCCGFYISSHLNFIPRDDLSKHSYLENNHEFEAIWIEIISKNDKDPNLLFASIYRHPGKNYDKFLSYINSVLSTVNTEKKDSSYYR